MNRLKQFFPPAQWLRSYSGEMLQGDLTAGLTVGVMLIPQGMAYALIAGLPPIYGLYASLVPLIVYAFFGTSRQLAVGPTALASLLTAAGVAPLAGGDTELYITLALVLSLMVGVIQVVLGLLRFGFLANFLAHPVLSGFTSAAALIIGVGQLKHILGLQVPRSDYVHEIVLHIVEELGAVHVPTLVLGLLSIGLLVGLRWWKKAFPGALALVVLATAGVWLFGLDGQGVKVVGDVPGGLPGFRVPPWNVEYMRDLMPAVLTLLPIGIIESLAVAKVYASRNRYEIDANQELIGLGASKIAGAFFQAFPTTGGFSRTAVNADAGARSQIASLISAGIIALTLLLLTSLFTYLPNAALGAIIIVAVAGLVDVRGARYLWKVDRKDFFLMLLTFLATLALGIEEGILVGVVASLILVIQKSSRPHAAVMGRLPGTTTYRNVERNPEALTHSRVAVLRIDASLYFANVAFLKEKIQEVQRRDPSLKVLIFDAYPVNRIDASAAHALKEIIEDLHRQGIRLYFASVKGPVMDVLKRAGIVDLVGREHFFLEVHDAMDYAERGFDEDSASEKATPELVS